MVAPRLPWIKLHVEALEHPKVALLTDAQYRTWIYVLLRGSQQPDRYRFASVRHLQKVTGRDLRTITPLLGTLLDLHDDGTVEVHDWQQWQRWMPDVEPKSATFVLANDSPSTNERHVIVSPSTRQQLAIGAPTTHDQHANGTDKPSERLENTRARGPEIEIEIERETEIETPPLATRGSPHADARPTEASDADEFLPEGWGEQPDPEPQEDVDQRPPDSAPDHAATAAKTNGRRQPIDAEYLAVLLAEFAPRLGGQEAAQLSADKALNHKAYDRAKDKRQYLRNWLRTDAARVRPAATGSHHGQSVRERFAMEISEFRPSEVFE